MRKKHLLILSQYYPPEVGATQTRAHEFAKYIKSKGMKVTVICELPNHPEGIIYKNYKKRFITRENYEGIDVYRSWIYTKPEKSSIDRVLFYLSYFIMAVYIGITIRNKFDIIWATSPPLPVGMASWVISKITRKKYIIDIRDIWPAAAVALGELSSKGLVKFFEKVERVLYKDAFKITTVTPGFVRYINDISKKKSDIILATNGTMPEVFFPINNRNNELRKSVGISDKTFVVTFAGLHGLAQGLDVVLKAAKILEDYDIKFLFIGEGPYKKYLISKTKMDNISNVIFHDKVELKEINKYLNISDVLLVTLKSDKIFNKFIPSKMFDYMATAKPIILNVPGDAENILRKTDCGIYVSPDSENELAEAVVFLKNNSRKRTELGENGRKHVLRNYTRNSQYQKIYQTIK